MQQTVQNRQAGFTLVELSIVLVIIGLIVGGVLVGQDMIKAAEIRATVAQIEKYNSALNTFRDKFNGYPGDLTLTLATNFGFTGVGSGADAHSDGDGLIEGCTSLAATVAFWGCENLLFWNHLFRANLIPDALTTVEATGLNAVLDMTAAGAVTNYVPLAKMGRGNYISVFTNGGLNYYYIAGKSFKDCKNCCGSQKQAAK